MMGLSFCDFFFSSIAKKSAFLAHTLGVYVCACLQLQYVLAFWIEIVEKVGGLKKGHPVPLLKQCNFPIYKEINTEQGDIW